jgi:hypothetical protein
MPPYTALEPSRVILTPIEILKLFYLIRDGQVQYKERLMLYKGTVIAETKSNYKMSTFGFMFRNTYSNQLRHNILDDIDSLISGVQRNMDGANFVPTIAMRYVLSTQ